MDEQDKGEDKGWDQLDLRQEYLQHRKEKEYYNSLKRTRAKEMTKEEKRIEDQRDYQAMLERIRQEMKERMRQELQDYQAKLEHLDGQHVHRIPKKMKQGGMMFVDEVPRWSDIARQKDDKAWGFS